MCGQPVEPGTGVDDRTTVTDLDGRPQPAHRVCMLRNVMGGIGHLTDHQRWCIEVGDPDMGLSYYDSALLVDEWVAKNGFEAAQD